MPDGQSYGLIPQQSKYPTASIVETVTKGTCISVREGTASIGRLCAVAIGTQDVARVLIAGRRVDLAGSAVAAVQCHLIAGLIVDTFYYIDLASVRPVGADGLQPGRALRCGSGQTDI